jgi:hypothetical protein
MYAVIALDDNHHPKENANEPRFHGCSGRCTL